MTNGGLLLIFIISLASTAPLYSSSDASLAFPDYKHDVKLVKDTLVKPDPNKPNRNDRELISITLNTEKIVINDQIYEGLISLDYGEDNQKICIPKIFNFKQKIDTITRLDYDPLLLLPGNVLLMINPFNFAKGVLNNFISPNKRNPFNVTLFNGLNQYFPITNIVYLIPKLREIMRKNVAYLDSQPIRVYIEQAASIERLLKDLGLSSKVYQNILIGGQTAQKVQFNEGKIVIVMHQKLFSAAFDLSQNGTKKEVNLLDSIFTSLYTYDQFSFSRLNGNSQRWAQVVTQTNFGRLLILSVDDTADNRRIVQRLSNCFNNVTLASEACIDAPLQQIQINPTVRFYVAGVQQSSALYRNIRFPVYKEIVNWRKVFANFDGPYAIDNLRPLSAKLTDLLGQKFSQTQNRYFSIFSCPKVPDLSVTITSIQGTCTVHIKGGKDVDYSKLLFTTSRSDTFAIGEITGWQPFDIRISLKGNRHKPGFFLNIFKRNKQAEYDSKLEFTVNFNGETRYKTIGPFRSQKETQEYVFRVDPRKAIIK